MKYLFYILFISCLQSINAQTDTILLNVDILGQEYPLTSYHHPINGKYLIERNQVYELTKKQLDLFGGFEFINPTAKFHNGINYVQANSLRHYIDVDEMIYLKWGAGRFDTNKVKIQNFIDSTKMIRYEKYQSRVESYFDSFFIRRTEVTNYQYRQFVYWVKDSLMMEEIYLHYPDFNEVKQLLDIPKGIEILDTNDRVKIRKMYNLNFNCEYMSEKVLDQIKVIPIISGLYLSPSVRWYKRKEIDVECLYFSTFSEGIEEVVNIYPDTLVWANDYPHMYNDPKVNMYFWHPAYDNFPVVGVSKKQAQLFCIWKEQQFKNQMSTVSLPFDIKIELPSTKDYENTVRYRIHEKYEKQIEDNEIITNLYLVRHKSIKSTRIYPRQNNISVFLTTNKVYIPSSEPKTRKERKVITWFTESRNKKEPYDKEYHDLLMQRVMENYIYYKIYFLSNNVSEWMTEDYENNYEQLAKAYINYNCFSSIDYCEGQRIVDEKLLQQNDKNGNLIMGGNWYDERYGSYLGVNKAGLYPKTFKES